MFNIAETKIFEVNFSNNYNQKIYYKGNNNRIGGLDTRSLIRIDFYDFISPFTP